MPRHRRALAADIPNKTHLITSLGLLRAMVVGADSAEFHFWRPPCVLSHRSEDPGSTLRSQRATRSLSPGARHRFSAHTRGPSKEPRSAAPPTRASYQLNVVPVCVIAIWNIIRISHLACSGTQLSYFLPIIGVHRHIDLQYTKRHLNSFGWSVLEVCSVRNQECIEEKTYKISGFLTNL